MHNLAILLQNFSEILFDLKMPQLVCSHLQNQCLRIFLMILFYNV